ncbi:MAG: OmpA family protein [bacterium]|nr:OmpA family protein [bacterium]MDT8367329.1 OmpA family protein [bacterium]
MEIRRYWGNLLSIVLVTGLLGACAGPKLMVEPVSVPQDPAVAMAQLEAKLVEGRQDQLNVLSPTWFAKAENSLGEARKINESKGEIARIGDAASRGLTEIRQAEEIGRIVRTAIPEAVEARKMARTAGATSFGQDYADVETRFLGLTRDVENNDLKSAKKDQKGVVVAFHVLEIKAIKETILGDTRKILKQAEEEGARKLAPEQYAEAQQEFNSVEEFIAANPYETEDMKRRGTVALFKANRLLEITRQTERLRGMEPLETALWFEGYLRQASEALGAPDMRDKTFDLQESNIVGSITSLVEDRDFLAQKADAQQEAMDIMRSRYPEEIEALRKTNASDQSAMKQRYDKEIEGLMGRIASLEGQSREEAARLVALQGEQRAERERIEAERIAERERIEAQKRAAEERLAAERRFNELYNEVQALFTKDEAECYKQGNRMVIRLRGMTFPVGQAVIMPENYPLLSKVQRAVRTFTEPQVTIEGHTDSTGTSEFNEHLSQQRAESVREYLLANNVVAPEHVVAAGFGSSRPLAPNITAAGRAANRRIDVVITPGDMPVM